MKADVLEQSRGGMWAWLFQRVTAVVLIIGLTTHVIATHIFALGELDYANIADRLASWAFVLIDVSLLAAVLYHALNGARMVLLDYWFAARSHRLTLAVVLWVIGLAAFGYGMWALWPWIGN